MLYTSYNQYSLIGTSVAAHMLTAQKYVCQAIDQILFPVASGNARQLELDDIGQHGILLDEKVNEELMTRQG